MSDLETIAALARQALELEDALSELEEQMDALKKQHRGIVENDIPEAMDAADVQEFKLSDGRKVTVEDKIRARIPSGRAHEAFGWLRRHGHDGIIKRTVTAKFGKGQDELADRVLTAIEEVGGDGGFDLKSGDDVHHSTLRAFVREQIENGEPVPMDLFGVHIQRFAKIK